MKLHNKHWGSTIGIIMGILFLISPLGNPELNNSGTSYTGILIILGNLAYRSRKKQTLSNSRKFPTLEIIAVLALLLHITFGLNNGLWYEYPLNFALVPIWILVSYVSLFVIKKTKI